MSTPRLTGEFREKQLRLAVARIQRGRAHTGVTKLTIASVAREAGVSTALIHNCHAPIAELIRNLQGRSARTERDAIRKELAAQRTTNQGLRAEIKAMRVQIAKLASINEVLAIENGRLKVAFGQPRVVDIGTARRLGS